MSYIRKRRHRSGQETYYIGFKDQYGRWREKAAGTRRKDAEAFLRRVLEEVASGTYGRQEEDPTLSEFFSSFLQAKASTLKGSTMEDYRLTFGKHVLPRLGKRRLSELSPAVVQKLLLDLEKEGLSAATQGKVLRYLKTVLRHAVRLELIDRDPCRAVSAPRVEKKEQRFLAPEELDSLLEAADGYLKPLLAVACYAGLRQGEILALTWRDIDFQASLIRVRRTYHYAHGFSAPKTPASRRDVPMIPTLRAMLEEHYNASGKPGPDDLVFPNSASKPMDRRNLVRRGFSKALERSGIGDIRFHDLRHTFASLCIAGGVDPKTLQAMMGHSSIRVTMDTYGHLYRDALDRASRSLEAVVSGGPKVVLLSREARTARQGDL